MKFRSDVVVRKLASLIALVFCAASSAFAASRYTVAWYANPSVTNVAYDAIAVAAGLSAGRAAADTFFLEAEAFADRGGWVSDTQFMDQMGSPYLLAHGMGVKVADAETVFEAG